MFLMQQNMTSKIRQKVKDSYSAIAHEFDQTRKIPWKEFNNFLPYIKDGAKVLDLGCGNGRLYEFLKQKNVDYLGVDNNSELLEKAKQNFPETSFQLGDMVDIGVDEKTFDNLFCIAAFHHLPGRKLRNQAVNNMHSVLKDDGVLILTTWNLFQTKYWKEWIHSIFLFVISFGFKNSWNDLWIKWGKYPIKRYYHSFFMKELLKYFPKNKWEMVDFYFTHKGNRVSFWRSYNLCLILKKI